MDPLVHASIYTDSGIAFKSHLRKYRDGNEQYIFEKYRDILKRRYSDFRLEELHDFLLMQSFSDCLLVRFTATDVDHSIPSWTLDWDFKENTLVNRNESNNIPYLELAEFPGHRYLEITVRRYALGYTIRNSLPWEEFSIGFQARFYRKPDTYNFEFWNYFQNKYNYENRILEDFKHLWNSDMELKQLCAAWAAINRES